MIMNTVYCHSVDVATAVQRDGAVRHTIVLQFLCESIHLCFTLRSVQTLSQANTEQEQCWLNYELDTTGSIRRY